jgi:hypothetical protein
MIRGDHVGKNVADLAVPGLNAGKDKPVKQNREALPARQGGYGFVSLPGLREDLGLLRMFAAIDEAHLVRQSGRSRKKASRKQQKVSFPHHRPSLGPRARRAHYTVIEPGRVYVKWPKGQYFPASTVRSAGYRNATTQGTERPATPR